MRLLIIAPESYPVPSAKGTSVETCIYNIAHNMAMRHRVTVVSRMAKHLPRSSIRGGVQIIHVKGSTRRVYLTRVLQAIRGQSFDHIQVD
ncbi:MAG: glycosyltransferase family 1 protein, partial [Bacillota bacterium]|nr:glycosyltransferase family 1 protein [Bacillota bacterium]